MQFQEFDAAYIAKLRAGDNGTAEHFVSYFSELIQLKLRSRLPSHEAVEDVRQETFTRVFAALRSETGLRHAERLGSFVNSVCNFVLLEHYRAHPRTDAIETEDEEGHTLPSHDPDALSQLVSNDEVRVVRETVENLTERDRRLLRGVFLDERDKDDVCRELGVDREYLRVLLHRAKLAFKTVYAKRSQLPRPRWKG